MPTAITAYKVLLEVPDDLEAERRTFGDAIHSFNETDAVPRGVLFVPLGWAAGAALPRHEVSRELQAIDCVVFVLGDRWRSGAEEEFELALECLHDGDHPMSKIVVLFKAVPSSQLSDPGELLKPVLAFRQKLETERKIAVETFDDVESFRTRLRWHLSRWLIEHEQRAGAPRGLLDQGSPLRSDTAAGRWKPHPLGDDPDSLNEYGLFLQRDGMVDEAVEIHERALALARTKDKPIAMAVAYGNLGVICERRHDRERAEEMLRRALEICEAHDRRVGAAACYHGLGTVHRAQDRLDEAEQMYRKALQVERELDRPDGMAACYASLAVLYDYQRERDRADEMRKLALTVREEPEYPRGGLFPSSI